MSEEAKKTEEDEGGGKKRSLTNLVVLIVAGLVCIAGGFITPILLLPSSGDASEETINAKKAAEPKLDLAIPDPDEEVDFIPFDDDGITVNFNDPRFSRYLKIKFNLQVAKSQVEEIKQIVEDKRGTLRNWLIGHIADKRAEDLRGKQGANRMRREIHDAFNEMLFTDGIERVQDVLFDNFIVQ